MSQDITILLIHHKHGINAYNCDCEETARKILENYVAYWWEIEIAEEMPEDDPEEAVNTYFEMVSGEYYDIFPAGPVYTMENLVSYTTEGEA